MIIFATHRLVSRLKDFSVERLLAGLGDDFEIFEFRFDSKEGKSAAQEKMLKKMKSEAANDRNAYGIYAGGGAFRVAVLKDRKLMSKAAAERSEAWRRLEVAVLHKLILERLLGIGETQLAAKSNLEYVTDRDDAAGQVIAKVDAGDVQAAFFVNPEKIKLIQQTAGAGEKMPQKSTFFWPKMYTGLTIYKM
jgi:uncharacterized protein (DUF1015 family)